MPTIANENITLLMIEKFPYQENKPKVKTNELTTKPIAFMQIK